MRFLPVPTSMMRLTKMPGVWMWSGSSLAGRHQLLDLGHRDLGSGRHHRVEIARGLAVDQVAGGVALPGVDDGEVGEQAALHDVLLAVEFLHFLAFGDQRADAGLGVEGRDTGAAGADALGQRALRIEFEFQFAGEILLREQLVLADIGRDHLLDLPRLQQPAEADAVDAGIVGDDRQTLDAGIRGSRPTGSRRCRTGRSRRT